MYNIKNTENKENILNGLKELEEIKESLKQSKVKQELAREIREKEKLNKEKRESIKVELILAPYRSSEYNICVYFKEQGIQPIVKTISSIYTSTYYDVIEDIINILQEREDVISYLKSINYELNCFLTDIIYKSLKVRLNIDI